MNRDDEESQRFFASLRMTERKELIIRRGEWSEWQMSVIKQPSLSYETAKVGVKENPRKQPHAAN
jgi:hypothetical protein